MHPVQEAGEPLAAFLEPPERARDGLGLNEAQPVAPAPAVPEPVRGRPVAVPVAGWIGDHAVDVDLLPTSPTQESRCSTPSGRCPARPLQSMVDGAVPEGVASYAGSGWL